MKFDKDDKWPVRPDDAEYPALARQYEALDMAVSALLPIRDALGVAGKLAIEALQDEMVAMDAYVEWE